MPSHQVEVLIKSIVLGVSGVGLQEEERPPASVCPVGAWRGRLLGAMRPPGEADPRGACTGRTSIPITPSASRVQAPSCPPTSSHRVLGTGTRAPAPQPLRKVPERLRTSSREKNSLRRGEPNRRRRSSRERRPGHVILGTLPSATSQPGASYPWPSSRAGWPSTWRTDGAPGNTGLPALRGSIPSDAPHFSQSEILHQAVSYL